MEILPIQYIIFPAVRSFEKPDTAKFYQNSPSDKFFIIPPVL